MLRKYVIEPVLAAVLPAQAEASLVVDHADAGGLRPAGADIVGLRFVAYFDGEFQPIFVAGLEIKLAEVLIFGKRQCCRAQLRHGARGEQRTNIYPVDEFRTWDDGDRRGVTLAFVGKKEMQHVLD